MIAEKLRMLALLTVCLVLTLAAVRRGVFPQNSTARNGLHQVSSPPSRRTETLTMSVPVEIVETGKATERREISVIVGR